MRQGSRFIGMWTAKCGGHWPVPLHIYSPHKSWVSENGNESAALRWIMDKSATRDAQGQALIIESILDMEHLDRSIRLVLALRLCPAFQMHIDTKGRPVSNNNDPRFSFTHFLCTFSSC